MQLSVHERDTGARRFHARHGLLERDPDAGERRLYDKREL